MRERSERTTRHSRARTPPTKEAALGGFTLDARYLEPPFTVLTDALSARPISTCQQRRTWFDTHDWRLFRAGMLLERRGDGATSRLMLTDRTGATIADGPAGRHMITGATLPAGGIRDRVAPLLGLRELLPRVRATGSRSVLAVLDEEEKTVARVGINTLISDTGGAPVLRVQVTPLRGYDKQARQADAALAALPDVTAAETPLFTALATGVGLLPGVHRSAPEPRFTARTPALAVVVDTLGQLRGTALDNLDGTLRELDTEFLHDLRVAVRRSRSLVKVAGDILPAGAHEYLNGELKWLADATSDSRDLDVTLLDFEAGRDAADLAPYRALLARRCRRAHTGLNRVLRSERFRALMDRWEQDMAGAGPGGSRADIPIAKVSHDLVTRAWTRMSKRGAAIGPCSPAESLHDLRKRAKELRYLLEFFGSLYDRKDLKAFVRELKQLQDNLGEFQDTELQCALVRTAAEELRSGGAPTDTLLAVGRITQELTMRQVAAREDFGARWARFHSKENRRRFARMVGGGNR